MTGLSSPRAVYKEPRSIINEVSSSATWITFMNVVSLAENSTTYPDLIRWNVYLILCTSMKFIKLVLGPTNIIGVTCVIGS